VVIINLQRRVLFRSAIKAKEGELLSAEMENSIESRIPSRETNHTTPHRHKDNQQRMLPLPCPSPSLLQLNEIGKGIL
jgi:hypothetical protein